MWYLVLNDEYGDPITKWEFETEEEAEAAKDGLWLEVKEAEDD